MTWILTASGRHFDYANPTPDMISINDIALALSREARFNGHTRQFYSVAQHSVMVSRLVPAHLALEALLHDGTEAYMKDLPSPLKRLLTGYRAVELRVDWAIRETFGLPMLPSPEVHAADLVMLATERRDLMPDDPCSWPVLNGVAPMERQLEAWTQEFSREAFLNRAGHLMEIRSDGALA